MTKFLKYILIAAIGLFIAIQLYPVDRSNPSIKSNFDGPPEVEKILRQSCYDCHSNESNWPWYSYVAPVSWLVAYDVHEGREELNFSEWNDYRNDGHLIEEIVEEVEEGEMPLPIYLLTHGDAEVSPEQLDTLRQWVTSLNIESKEDHEEDHDD